MRKRVTFRHPYLRILFPFVAFSEYMNQNELELDLEHRRLYKQQIFLSNYRHLVTHQIILKMPQACLGNAMALYFSIILSTKSMIFFLTQRMGTYNVEILILKWQKSQSSVFCKFSILSYQLTLLCPPNEGTSINEVLSTYLPCSTL